MSDRPTGLLNLGAILELAGRVPGTYLLILRLDRPAKLRIGGLGQLALPAGTYLYAGSAMSGLRQRIQRHLSRGKVQHWHLDYLLARARITGALGVVAAERLECRLAAALLQLPGARRPVPRFGASDCRCAGHLVWLPHPPSLRQLGQVITKLGPREPTR